MPATALPATPGTVPRQHPTTSWHRPLVVFAAMMAALTVVCVIEVFADQRVLVGAPIWLKPLKFAISFTIFSTSLGWMISLLRRGKRLAWWCGTAFAGASAVEVAIIVTQVVRGTQSHFNRTTPLNTALYNVMGATIVALWLATLVISVLAVRHPLRADRALTVAVRLGLGLSLVGLALGGLMLIPTAGQLAHYAGIAGAHSVGVPDGGPGLPVVNWSTTGGDLRIPHFVGIHALQLIPLVAVVTRDRLSETRRVRLVMVAAAGYAGFLALLTWQALRGQPLVHPDLATTIAAAALVIGITIAASIAIAAGPAIRKTP